MIRHREMYLNLFSVIREHAYNVVQRERRVTDLTFELARLERNIVREKMPDLHGVLIQMDVVLAQVFAETFGLPQLPQEPVQEADGR